MMNFDSVDVKSNNFENKFISPGIELVKFTKIEAGAAGTGTPFVELTVENKEALTCSTRFYFAPGKNTEISVQALYSFIAVTNGFDVTNEADKVKVKASIGNFLSYEDLAVKLSSLLIGKLFALVIKGKYVDNKDSSRDSWIKGEISSTVATVANIGTLKHDPSKVNGTFVKGLGNSSTTVDEKASATSSAASWS